MHLKTYNFYLVIEVPDHVYVLVGKIYPIRIKDIYMIRYFCHKIKISLSPPSPFRAHTSAIVARAKVNVLRSFYQCHVIHDTHISCGSDDVTCLSEQSERQINAVQVRLRHIHDPVLLSQDRNFFISPSPFRLPHSAPTYRLS
jgi:hypothetical protein